MPLARAYLFDLDGTLIDTAPDLVCAVNHCLAQAGYPQVSVDRLRNWVGRGGRALLAEAFSSYGAPEPAQDVYQVFLDYYAQHIADHSLLYEGVLSALNRLQAADCSLSVVTNKYRHLAIPLLDALKLSDFFVTIVGGDCTDSPKPHPKPLLLACERMQVTPVQTIMVGDAYYDEAAAVKAGVGYRQVTYGYTVPGLRPDDLSPPAMIDSLTDLLDN